MASSSESQEQKIENEQPVVKVNTAAQSLRHEGAEVLPQALDPEMQSSAPGAGGSLTSSYPPQFSAATNLKLSQLAKGTYVLQSPSRSVEKKPTIPHPDKPSNDAPPRASNQDLRATLALPPTGSKTATLQGLASSSISTRPSLSSNGIKRKRDSESSIPDFTKNTVHFPPAVEDASQYPPIPPGGKMVATTAHDDDACLVCGSRLWRLVDVLIKCARCSRCWHQLCASPPISDERGADLNFHCDDCLATGPKTLELGTGAEPTGSREIERLRRKNLDRLPRSIVPAKPELVGFGSGNASDASRTRYFSRKNKTDLLNVLSLCDQLKPQLLVDIMVSVSKKHPDLPIFDAPNWSREGSSGATLKPVDAHRSSRPYKRPRHGHSIINSKARNKIKGSRKVMKREVGLEANTEIHVVEHVLPPTWPKAEQGLYSKLPPEVEDRAILADKDDDEAFSHFMVDKLGQPQPVSACG